MSEVFAKPHQRTQQAPNQETIAKMLEENNQLVSAISDQFNKGRMQDTFELQKLLHRNLVYLACLAYPNMPLSEVQNLIPSPEAQMNQHQMSIMNQQNYNYQQQQQQQQQNQMKMMNTPIQQPVQVQSPQPVRILSQMMPQQAQQAHYQGQMAQMRPGVPMPQQFNQQVQYGMQIQQKPPGSA